MMLLMLDVKMNELNNSDEVFVQESNYQDFCCPSACVCVFVTDVGVAVTNLWVVCKMFTYISAFTEMAIILLVNEMVKLFGVLDQNKTRFFTYVLQRAESKAATVTTSD